LASANDSLKSSYDGLASAQDSLASGADEGRRRRWGRRRADDEARPGGAEVRRRVKALKPAFEDLRLDVQQRLFEGLDKTVTNLGNAWIPALKVTLGSYADTFNQFFKNLGSSITTPKFISDLQAGAEGFRQGFEDIGTAVTDSLVPAFGALPVRPGRSCPSSAQRSPTLSPTSPTGCCKVRRRAR
jgi:hypothetical protein